MTNPFAEELFLIVSTSKTQNSHNHDEIKVMTSIKKALIKALNSGDNEFDLTLSRNQYGNSPESLEALYLVFKNVIEDDEGEEVKLSISIK